MWGPGEGGQNWAAHGTPVTVLGCGSGATVLNPSSSSEGTPPPPTRAGGQRDGRVAGRGWLGFRAWRVSNDLGEVLPSAGGHRLGGCWDLSWPCWVCGGWRCYLPPVTPATEPRASKGLSAEWVPCPTVHGTRSLHTHQLGLQVRDMASRREAPAAPDGGAGPPFQRTPFRIRISLE